MTKPLRLSKDTSPAGVQRQLTQIQDAINDFIAPPSALTDGAGAAPATLTDNVPRWVAIDVPYTLFTPTVNTTIDVTLTTLPPGAVWTMERIDVGTTFVSAGATWRMTIKVPVGGTSVGGTPKGPDITTPDAFALRIADQVVASDPAAACDVTVNIDSGGFDTANQLTQGVVTVHLFVSVPGSNASDLPPA
jgi:hypothetical protein